VVAAINNSLNTYPQIEGPWRWARSGPV